MRRMATESNTSATPAAVLADASTNAMRCSSAKARPSSSGTSRASARSDLLPTKTRTGVGRAGRRHARKLGTYCHGHAASQKRLARDTASGMKRCDANVPGRHSRAPMEPLAFFWSWSTQYRALTNESRLLTAYTITAVVCKVAGGQEQLAQARIRCNASHLPQMDGAVPGCLGSFVSTPVQPRARCSPYLHGRPVVVGGSAGV